MYNMLQIESIWIRRIKINITRYNRCQKLNFLRYVAF